MWLTQLRQRWFGKTWTLKRHPQRRRRMRQSRLYLEALETRVLPSVTFIVDGTSDSAAPAQTFTDGSTVYVASLRQAIIDANADPSSGTDIIQLSAVYPYSLTLQNSGGQVNNAMTGDLTITNTSHALIIEGTGSSGGGTIIDAGNLNDRVFQIASGANVTFKNLTIQGGKAMDDGTLGATPGSTADARGGGILNNGGKVTLSNVRITSNYAAGLTTSGQNGQDGQGGGIYSSGGSLTLSHGTQIVSNHADGGYGGNGKAGTPNGGNGGDGEGGGVYVAGGMVFISSDSDIGKNNAYGGTGGNGASDSGTVKAGNGGNGGNAFGGGLYVLTGHVTLNGQSALSDNYASGDYGGYGATSGGYGGHGGYNNANNTTGNDGSQGSGSGGGLYVKGGAVTISGGTTLASNSAPSGGGIAVSGTGAVSLKSGSVRSNYAISGGGLYVAGGKVTISGGTVGSTSKSNNSNSALYGGGIAVSGTGAVSMKSGTLSNNGAIYGGGLYVGGGTITLTNSALTSNIAGGASIGVNGSGGGIYAAAGNVTLINDTVSENQATKVPTVPISSGYAEGGGIYVATTGNVTLISDTLSDNSATVLPTPSDFVILGGVDNSMMTSNGSAGITPFANRAQGQNSDVYASGGGVYISSGGSVKLTNTLIAGNIVSTSVPGSTVTDADVAGTVASSDHDLIGDIGDSSGWGDNGGAPNLLGNSNGNPIINAQLGSLTNNGGPTQTMALLAGSPAIDAGDTNAAPGAIDQRGYARIVGAGIDIGAYEYDPNNNISANTNLSVTGSVSDSSVSAGGTITYTLTVTNNGPNDQSNVTLSDVLPANTTLNSWEQTSGNSTWTLNPSTGSGTVGTVSAWTSALANGDSATFTLALNATGGTTIDNTAAVGPTANNTGNSTFQFQTVDVAPVITSLSPPSAVEGQSGITLDVYGSDFNSDSVVEWNGVALATTLIGSLEVDAVVPTADLAEEGSASITVVNSATGATSNAVAFTINDAPLSATLAPLNFVQGEAPNNYLAATFTDANPNGRLSDYTATVDWGDGDTSSSAAGNVTIQADPNQAGVFDVLASKPNPYATTGTSYVVSSPFTVTVNDVGGASDSQSATPTIAAVTTTSLGSALTTSNGNVTLSAGSADQADSIVSAVNTLTAPAPGTTETVVLNLVNGASLGDVSASPPTGVTLIINGAGGSTTIVGNSPALTVLSGDVIVENGVTLSTSTEAPTILVKGGSLTLRNDTVEQSSTFGLPDIEILGGNVDLGTAADPGGNTFIVNSGGLFSRFVTNFTANQVFAVGDTFQTQQGSNAVQTLTDPYAIESHMFDGVYAKGFGLVTYVANNVYVPNDLYSLQPAIDAAPAGYTVNVQAGGWYSDYTVAQPLTVSFQNGPTLQLDATALAPGTTTLRVQGGSQNNTDIAFTPGRQTGSINVSINGYPTGTFAPSGGTPALGTIVAHTGSGNNDEIDVDHRITLLDMLFADGADAQLQGGGGPTVEVGGSGTHTQLFGGSGSNLLIAGAGGAYLHGGSDDDILIGGTTSYDSDEGALTAIMNEWTSATSFSAGVSAVTSPSFPYYLNSSTVHGNGAVNHLEGGSGQNLFFADALDKLSGTKKGQVISIS